MSSDVAAPYLQFLTTLTPDRIGELDRHCAPTVRFRDPFHDTAGIAAYRQVLRSMYEAMDVDQFTVTPPVCAGPVCHFEWTLRYRFRSPMLPRASSVIQGASRLLFDADGWVISHTDYWDAGVIYERVPGLGLLVRGLKGRIANA